MLLTESLVKMGKWSEGDQWEVEFDVEFDVPT